MGTTGEGLVTAGPVGGSHGVGLCLLCASHIFTHFLLTSATSAGVPKGVVLTHRALVSAIASQVAFLQDPCGLTGVARQQQQQEQQAAAVAAAGGGEERAAAPEPSATTAVEAPHPPAAAQPAENKRAYPSYYPK